MAGRQRTLITPLQVGAIKEMVGNEQFNGDMARSISHNRRTNAYFATATRGYGGLADNVYKGRTNVVSECELLGLRLLEQDALVASLAVKNEKHDAEITNAAEGPSASKFLSKRCGRPSRALHCHLVLLPKTFLLVCQQGHTPRRRGTAGRGPTTGCSSSSPTKAPV